MPLFLTGDKFLDLIFQSGIIVNTTYMPVTINYQSIRNASAVLNSLVLIIVLVVLASLLAGLMLT